jgi:hypothetical protein
MPSGIRCPNCGNYNNPNWKLCNKCSAVLGPSPSPGLVVSAPIRRRIRWRKSRQRVSVVGVAKVDIVPEVGKPGHEVRPARDERGRLRVDAALGSVEFGLFMIGLWLFVLVVQVADMLGKADHIISLLQQMHLYGSDVVP